EIESLGLRQQPVQADRRQTGVLDHRAQLATTVRGKVRNSGRQGEGSNLQAFVSQPLDGVADLAELPALEQLVADAQTNHAGILPQGGSNPPTVKSSVDWWVAPTLPDMARWRPHRQPGRLERVPQEHGDRHGPDAAGHGGDLRGDRGHTREIDIATERAVIALVNADVNDDRAGLDPA